MSNPESAALAKRFEPILLFHPDESFFPIDPKLYLERSALWRNTPPTDRKQEWGEPPASGFPRRPQLPKGAIAALQSEVTGGKTWIGTLGADGTSPYLVIPEPEGERPLADDRFLQLAGWEPYQTAPNEVTAGGANRHPTLAPSVYNGALLDGRPWYYVEHLTTQQLFAEFGSKTPNGLDLFRVINDPRLSSPELLVYHFFYALHEEPLRGCEQAGEGQTFATFAGEWASVALLFNSAREPLYIGLTSRNIGDPTSIPALPGQEHRIGMTVHPWREVDAVGTHPKIYVSLGTHGNYLRPGAHSLTPFTPGDVDLNQGTCAQIEKLDDVIPGGEAVYTPGASVDWGVFTLKYFINVLLGFIWGTIEALNTSFGEETPAIEPDRTPQDETGGPLFGKILRPAGLFVPEQASAASTEDWQVKEGAPGDRPRYDFVVDRETQLWWPPRGKSRGYAGRWGPRVTNDPKGRRAGMRCPPFALLLLEGIARV